jgi:hypothetical protein
VDLIPEHPSSVPGRTALRAYIASSSAGEATYAQMIWLGDEIHLRAGQRFRVLDVVVFDAEDESPFVGLLQVEAATQ